MKNKALAYRKVQVLMSLGIKVTSAIKDRLYELSADEGALERYCRQLIIDS